MKWNWLSFRFVGSGFVLFDWHWFSADDFGRKSIFAHGEVNSWLTSHFPCHCSLFSADSLTTSPSHWPVWPILGTLRQVIVLIEFGEIVEPPWLIFPLNALVVKLLLLLRLPRDMKMTGAKCEIPCPLEVLLGVLVVILVVYYYLQDNEQSPRKWRRMNEF